jgi:hypothetical protein
MKVLLLKSFILVFSINVIGCIGSEDASSKDASSNDGDKSDSPNELVGVWSGCTQIGSGNNSVLSVVEFTNTTMKDYEVDYHDNSCSSTHNEESKITISNYTIGGGVTTDSGMAAKEINSTLTSGHLPSYGNRTYDIFYTDGTNLYFGLGDKSSSSSRPTALYFDFLFTKN